MSTARLRYLRRLMQRRQCRHHWIDDTRPGSRWRELVCNYCKRRREEDW